MKSKSNTLKSQKSIALIAHDNMKPELIDWVLAHSEELSRHRLFATGTTGELVSKKCELDITTFRSGPMGGDQQVGAAIAEGQVEFLVFFWDPLTPLSHDPDIKALLRMTVVWNIPTACNRATADFLLASRLMTEEYNRTIPDYEAYRKGRVAGMS